MKCARARVAVIKLCSLHWDDAAAKQAGLKAGARSKLKQLQFDFRGADLSRQDLSGLNLSDNLIEDISPLLRIQTLRSLNLAGNNSIPCRDVAELTRRMGANFTAPTACKP